MPDAVALSAQVSSALKSTERSQCVAHLCADWVKQRRAGDFFKAYVAALSAAEPRLSAEERAALRLAFEQMGDGALSAAVEQLCAAIADCLQPTDDKRAATQALHLCQLLSDLFDSARLQWNLSHGDDCAHRLRALVRQLRRGCVAAETGRLGVTHSAAHCILLDCLLRQVLMQVRYCDDAMSERRQRKLAKAFGRVEHVHSSLAKMAACLACLAIGSIPLGPLPDVVETLAKAVADLRPLDEHDCSVGGGCPSNYCVEVAFWTTIGYGLPSCCEQLPAHTVDELVRHLIVNSVSSASAVKESAGVACVSLALWETEALRRPLVRGCVAAFEAFVAAALVRGVEKAVWLSKAADMLDSTPKGRRAPAVVWYRVMSKFLDHHKTIDNRLSTVVCDQAAVNQLDALLSWLRSCPIAYLPVDLTAPLWACLGMLAVYFSSGDSEHARRLSTCLELSVVLGRDADLWNKRVSPLTDTVWLSARIVRAFVRPRAVTHAGQLTVLQQFVADCFFPAYVHTNHTFDMVDELLPALGDADDDNVVSVCARLAVIGPICQQLLEKARHDGQPGAVYIAPFAERVDAVAAAAVRSFVRLSDACSDDSAELVVRACSVAVKIRADLAAVAELVPSSSLGATVKLTGKLRRFAEALLKQDRPFELNVVQFLLHVSAEKKQLEAAVEVVTAVVRSSELAEYKRAFTRTFARMFGTAALLDMLSDTARPWQFRADLFVLTADAIKDESARQRIGEDLLVELALSDSKDGPAELSFCRALLSSSKSSAELVGCVLTVAAGQQLDKCGDDDDCFERCFDALFRLLNELVARHIAVVAPMAAALGCVVVRALDALVLRCGAGDSSAPLLRCCHAFSRLCVLMSGLKDDFAKVAPLVLCAYVDSLLRAPRQPPAVKSALLSGVNRLFDLCDEHGVALLSTNLSPAATAVFTALHTEYKTFYKYTGAV